MLAIDKGKERENEHFSLDTSKQETCFPELSLVVIAHFHIIEKKATFPTVLRRNRSTASTDFQSGQSDRESALEVFIVLGWLVTLASL